MHFIWNQTISSKKKTEKKKTEKNHRISKKPYSIIAATEQKHFTFLAPIKTRMISHETFSRGLTTQLFK